jgi:acetyltransferase-like isoleucine patch superfamily enzyme
MIGGRLRRRIKNFLVKKLTLMLKDVEDEIARDTLPVFANAQKNLRIDPPRRIGNSERITMGDDVYLGPGSLLVAITEYPGPVMNAPPDTVIGQYQPRITIGNRVNSTGGLQVAAFDEIVIEDDVLFATNVNITDGFHGYQNVVIPYKYQQIEQIKPIRIKRGCWIGQNVVISPGVVIGEFSIIGANSVVLKSVPDRCIAVGSPARVIKRWSDESESWISVNTDS